MSNSDEEDEVERIKSPIKKLSQHELKEIFECGRFYGNNYNY